MFQKLLSTNIFNKLIKNEIPSLKEYFMKFQDVINV
jgi:hypothetical protein